MNKPSVWLALGASISIFSIVAWMMLDNACSDLGSQIAESECRRGWVGAWSGWGATIAASIAAIVAYFTLSSIREQLQHAALQANLEQQRYADTLIARISDEMITLATVSDASTRTFSIEIKSVFDPHISIIESADFTEAVADHLNQIGQSYEKKALPWANDARLSQHKKDAIEAVYNARNLIFELSAEMSGISLESELQGNEPIPTLGDFRNHNEEKFAAITNAGNSLTLRINELREHLTEKMEEVTK